jgi:hypothetical protein
MQRAEVRRNRLNLISHVQFRSISIMTVKQYLITIVVIAFVAVPAWSGTSCRPCQDVPVQKGNAAVAGPLACADAALPAAETQGSGAPDASTTDDNASSSSDNDATVAAFNWTDHALITTFRSPRQLLAIAEPAYPINKPPRN